MKSRNDFLYSHEYKFYLQTYYAGIALNAYMVGPDFKNLTTMQKIVAFANETGRKMVEEIYNDKTFQHDNRRNKKAV